MKKFGLAIIAVCFISGLVATDASAKMGGGMGSGMMDMGPDTGDADVKPAKNKAKKAAPPAYQQNQ